MKSKWSRDSSGNWFLNIIIENTVCNGNPVPWCYDRTIAIMRLKKLKIRNVKEFDPKNMDEDIENLNIFK